MYDCKSDRILFGSIFSAATCFRNAKSFEQCRECLMKAADCHKQNRSLFYAAKAIDQAILICKELGDLRQIPSLAEKSANYYQTHGSADTAASSLDKAAKIMEAQYPEEALKLYQHAAEVVTVRSFNTSAEKRRLNNVYFRYKIICVKLQSTSARWLESTSSCSSEFDVPSGDLF